MKAAEELLARFDFLWKGAGDEITLIIDQALAEERRAGEEMASFLELNSDGRSRQLSIAYRTARGL